MSYQILKNQFFTSPPFTLVSLREQDIMAIREWRNAKMDVLRQNEPLTETMQKTYWKEVIMPTFSMHKPTQILFSYLKNEQLVGYGGLTHIDWHSLHAEVSFLMDLSWKEEEAPYFQAFSQFLSLLKKIAFLELKLHRLYTETYAMRQEHISAIETSGFIFEGRMMEHVKVGNRFVDSLIHGVINR